MEILESGNFLNQFSAIDIIHGIKSLGVRIALDDVGSAPAPCYATMDVSKPRINIKIWCIHHGVTFHTELRHWGFIAA